MSAIPTDEAIILEVHQSFGFEKLQTVQKTRFRKLEKKLSDHLKMGVGLIGDIIDGLEIGSNEELVRDLAQAAEEFLQFHSTIEATTRTYGINLRQVAWHLLAYQMMPGLGRKYAFWSPVAPLAPGMPDGDLWFLPRPHPSDSTRLQLPVQRVAEWWLGLLACPLEQIWRDEGADNWVRNFQNWRSGNLPNTDTIGQYFGDHQRFEYQNESLGEAGGAPTNESVRRYFLLARALQDGYCRLVKFITPGIDPSCSDPDRNKVLQLLQLFEESYQRTLQAEREAESPDEGNARFGALVPQWLAEGPYKAIMTVRGDEGDVLAGQLTDCFRGLPPEAPIENLLAEGHLTAGPSPQADDDKVWAERIEFEVLVRQARSAIDTGDKAGIERLIGQMPEHRRAEEFLADRLYIDARHRLAQNQTEQAKTLFKQAFEACMAASYGQLRQEIAYACLGIDMAFGYFSERAERYFRIIARQPDLRDGHPSVWIDQGFENAFRDVSAKAAERFWTEFYQPYPDTPRMAPPDQHSLEGLLEDFLELPDKNDEEIERFIRRHKKLLETKLRDIRGDTAFGMLMKLLNSMERKFRDKSRHVPATEFIRLRGHLHCVARKLSPKAFEVLDFKKQSTLMLAADAGDAELVRILLEKKVDRDVQDISGRTALHAAAASRSEKCYLLILKKGADPSRETIDGNSALETAVTLGLVKAVEETIAMWGDKFSVEERSTLRDQALDIHKSYKKFRRVLREEGRTIGPRPAYKTIAEIVAKTIVNQ